MVAAEQDVAKLRRGDAAQPKITTVEPGFRTIESFENPGLSGRMRVDFFGGGVATTLITMTMFLLWQF
jgi:hypothetical protein